MIYCNSGSSSSSSGSSSSSSSSSGGGGGGDSDTRLSKRTCRGSSGDVRSCIRATTTGQNGVRS